MLGIILNNLFFVTYSYNMRHFRTNKVNKISWNILIILIIIVLSLYLFISISVSNSAKLIKIAAIEVDNYNKELLMTYIRTDSLFKDDLNNVIELVKNNKDEIVAINYNMSVTYNILKIISNDLKDGFKNNLSDFSKNMVFQNNDYIVISYPLGIVSNNVYLNNLGPKVPLKMSVLSNIVTGIKTDVSNYGINNVLVSAYLSVDMTSNLVVPLVAENITEHYEILLDSKVVMGNVPTYMGSAIESQSPIVSN